VIFLPQLFLAPGALTIASSLGYNAGAGHRIAGRLRRSAPSTADYIGPGRWSIIGRIAADHRHRLDLRQLQRGVGIPAIVLSVGLRA